ncbi:MAG: hypothetical protein OQL27_07020 [Sedimenticola sp.]|nr:hypothetical protein [Sedimenticola sp.]
MNRRFLVILAILVSLLPFGFSFGLTTVIGDNHTASSSHMRMMGCDDISHDSGCVEMSAETPLHDDCCSDHCDSSFGSQLCVGNEYTFELPTGHLFQTYFSAGISGPVPSTLLRPPQLHA